MITGTLKSQVDRVWDAFWSGGIANPLTVIEQITYLLFAKRLDELHTAREKKANRLGNPVEHPIFSAGQERLRWSRFKDLDAAEMFTLFRDEVFPFIKNLHDGRESAYSRFMKDAVFVVPTPSLLQRVVTMLDAIPMEDRDTKGDLYEYMLAKIATAGQNGQFRTPRHIIKMMVEMTAPAPQDTISDPACGTCGFLVAAGEYLRERHPEIFHMDAQLRHFNQDMFHGSDFDNSMLRIGAMNMTLHGVEDPDIRGVDSLSQEGAAIRDRYTLVLKQLKPGGLSLDDKREPVADNDIPDILAKWPARNPETDTDRTAKAFFVPKDEIVANKYDLSINRYKEVEYQAVDYDPPLKILDELEALEADIQQDLRELREMVG